MSKQYSDKKNSGSRRPSRPSRDEDQRGSRFEGSDSEKKRAFKPKPNKYNSRDDDGNERPSRRPSTPAGSDRKRPTPYKSRNEPSSQRESSGPKRLNSKGEEVRPYRDRREDGPPKRNKTILRDGKFQGKYGADKKKSFSKSSPRTFGNIRLNKYIANSGICSRREADELIVTGLVEVNGVAVTEMGYQVKEGDKVTYAGERITPEKPVYILMNKPKDYITTLKDPEGRRTVMSLLRGAGDARVFPVGRLDRDTTGLLLFTNDGGLSKKLTHPTHGVKKLYHVHLNKTLKAADMKKLQDGIELEDGPMKADEISYVNEGKDKKQVGIEVHSGKNRIVRRMFEHLGYEVVKLDRVLFAGLSKKDLPRGKCRHLTQQELNTLKMLK
jgi:23S rRNA pseudouridine2605 synthase